ncbi:MAG: GAF domain-containing protein [candidate division Zixibacteria bacterium]|nr:GAF domain-containing protein [candidate division Zixibacteria bacterium]
MLTLFLGAFLFAAAFAVLFFWYVKRKKLDYLAPAHQRELFWGAAVLSLSVAFLVFSTEAFGKEPHWFVRFLSYALGAGGLGLVLAGMGSFVKETGAEGERLHRVERAITQLTEWGERFERAKNFRTFCELIVEGFAEPGGRAFLFKVSPDGKFLDFLAASGISPEREAASQHIPLEKSWFYQPYRSAVPFYVNQDLEIYNDYHRLFEPGERMTKAVFIPIIVQGGTVGILALFFPSAEPFLPEEKALFSHLSTFLGSAFQSLLASSYLARQEKRFRFNEEILGLSGGSSSPDKVAPELFRRAAEGLAADVLVFSILEPKGLRVRRFTIGRSGRLLTDKIPFHPAEPNWLALPLGGHTICLRRSEFLPQTPEEKFLASLGAASYLFKASELPHRWSAGLALGFEKPPAWGEEEERAFHNFYEAARILALRFQHTLLAEETERRLFSFVESSRLLLNTTQERELFSRAGEVLTQELPVTFSRFWKLGPEVLESASFCALRDISRDLPAEGGEKEVPLADLPWHRMALNEHRMVIVNEEDPEATMSEEEKAKTLARRVQAAVLIPMEVEGRALGLVSLGEMRSWKRWAFSPQDMAFARGISNQVALSLSGLSRKEAERRVGERLKSIEAQIESSKSAQEALEFFPNLDYSINNPLTAILGAVDLLRLKSENLPPEAGRYLSIIEKQAGRIHQSVQKVSELKNSVRALPARAPYELADAEVD